MFAFLDTRRVATLVLWFALCDYWHMDTTTKGHAPLSKIVAANVRAEGARRGLTQMEMAKRLGMSRITLSDRYRERTPWTLP